MAKLPVVTEKNTKNEILAVLDVYKTLLAEENAKDAGRIDPARDIKAKEEKEILVKADNFNGINIVELENNFGTLVKDVNAILGEYNNVNDAIKIGKEKLLDIIQSKEARENFIEFIYDHPQELDKWQQYYHERSRIRIIEWLRSHET